MKQLAYYFLFCSILCCFTSCGGNPLCKDVDCGPHGTCDKGNCTCEAGWTIGSDLRCTEKIPCYNVDCGHGHCNPSDETCICDMVYELDGNGKCNRLWREKFVGDWQGLHITDAGDTVGPYTMTLVIATSDIADVQITNFCNYSCISPSTRMTAKAITFDATTLSNFQSLCPTYGPISGHWTMIDESHVSMDISMFDGTSIVDCNGIFTKL